jgi:hypothetical protein
MEDIWKKLTSFLEQHFSGMNLSDLKKSTVSVGSGTQFYVRTPKAALWNNLPQLLESQFFSPSSGEARRGLPKLLTFGLENSFVCIWDDGSHSAALNTAYDKKLMEQLETTTKKLESVALSPYDKSWVLFWKDGSVSWNMDGLSDESYSRWKNWVIEYSNRLTQGRRNQ